MAAFEAVRALALSLHSRSLSGAASSPAGHGADAAAPTASDLGSRFEALAAVRTAEPNAVEVDERFDAALDQLRPTARLSAEDVRPAAHLGLLTASRPEAAGRWLLAALPLLHEVAPMAVLEVRVDRRTTLRAAALGTETRIDLNAQRNRRLTRLSGSPERLAGLALGGSRIPRKQRRGAFLLKELARYPFSLADLAATGASAIDPLSFWQLVAAVVPAVPEGVGGVLKHFDPMRSGFDAVVELRPGCPVRLLSQESVDFDAEVLSEGSGTLAWACTGSDSANGSEWLVAGDADVEMLALRTVARAAAGPDFHIRSQA